MHCEQWVGKSVLIASLCLLRACLISSAPTSSLSSNSTAPSNHFSTEQSDGDKFEFANLQLLCTFQHRNLSQAGSPYSNICSNISIDTKANVSSFLSDPANVNTSMCIALIFATNRLCTNEAVSVIQNISKTLASNPTKLSDDTTVESFCLKFQESVKLESDTSAAYIDGFFQSFFKQNKSGLHNQCSETCKSPNPEEQINLLCYLTSTGFELIQSLSSKSSILEKTAEKTGTGRQNSIGQSDVSKVLVDRSDNPSSVDDIVKNLPDTISPESPILSTRKNLDKPDKHELVVPESLVSSKIYSKNTSPSYSSTSEVPLSNNQIRSTSSNSSPSIGPPVEENRLSSSPVSTLEKVVHLEVEKPSEVKNENGDNGSRGRHFDNVDNKDTPEVMDFDPKPGESIGLEHESSIENNQPEEAQTNFLEKPDKIVNPMPILDQDKTIQENKLPIQTKDDTKTVFTTFDDEENSGYFGYFITFIGLSCFCFIMFHNKKRLIALVVEGRKPKGGRRRSVSGAAAYRKLENNFE